MKLKALKTAFPNTLPIFTGFLFLSLALGKYLPSAVFGMLVIYCLKNVSFIHGNHGIPELISIFVTGALHIWKRQTLISIAGGTICYMLLMQFVF